MAVYSGRRALRAAASLAVCGLVAGGAAPAVARPGQQPAEDAGSNAQEALRPSERQAQRLVRRMTLDEKVSLVHGTGFITGNGYTGHTPAIERLGIPEFFLADGPNGVGDGADGVTAFPASAA